MSQSYVSPDGAAFPVEWPDAEMAEQGWWWDQLHTPQPLSPLSIDMAEPFADGFQRAARASGAPSVGRRVYANGYAYLRFEPIAATEAAVQEGLRERDFAERAHRLLHLWETEYRPEVAALTRSLLGWEDRSWSLTEAFAHLDEVAAIRRRQGELHTYAMNLTGPLADRLIDWCISEFGPEGELMAVEAMQGHPNKSLESAVALWELSRVAGDLPAVAALIRRSPAPEVLERLPGVDGGREFREALDAFLNAYGHRNQAFTELSYPRWIEDPAFPLLMVRRYLDLPTSSSPSMLHAAQVRRREQRVAEIEAHVAADGQKLALFREYLDGARQRTVLIEDHNFWIDQAGMSATRTPCLALGRRMAKSGAIAEPEDVFYLRLAEIETMAASGCRDYRPEVSRRRAERERWSGLLPPAIIGKGDFKMNPALERFFGGAKSEPDGPRLVRGIPGSAGFARGTARVIRTLDDAERLAPGEILVTYATAPPWTPLFAVAAAVVTDAGGIVSHCAIVAREYGIPAVVGTRTATGTITDGMTVAVDGAAGTVTIEE